MSIPASYNVCVMVHHQVSELRSKLRASRDQTDNVRKNLDDAENEKRRLEHLIMNLKEDVEVA